MPDRLSKEDVNFIKKENLRYPKTLVKLDQSQWPLKNHVDQILGEELLEVFRSRTFLVQMFRQDNKHLRLSIQRTEWSVKKNRFEDGITWDELMQQKREAGFGDYCAVEIYPPDNLIVNVANIRHLFLYPAGTYPPFVWTNNLLS